MVRTTKVARTTKMARATKGILTRDDMITGVTTQLARLFPQTAPGPLDPPPRRIVILKPCCLGDLLMATPTFRALRQAYPEATIDLVVGKAAVSAVAGNPRLNTLLDPGPVGSGRAPWLAYGRLAQRLRAGRYDTAITLERSPIIGLLPWLAGIPRRIGLDSDGRGFAHTARIPAPLSAPRHEAEVYLDTLRAIGVTPTDPRLEFFPDHQSSVSSLQSSVFNHQSLIILHPAGGINPGMTLLAKRWPAERFAQLADRLAADTGVTIVLVGGPGDMEVSAAVRAQIDRPVVDLTGQLSFSELAVLIRHASVYIGNDTGATHLAVAMGAPTIMLMGPTDPRRYGPYRPGAPDTVAAITPSDVRPEDYLALRQAAMLDPHSPMSINRISVDQVYVVASRLLALPHR